MKLKVNHHVKINMVLKLIYVVIASVVFSNSWAAEYSFIDTDCKMLVPVGDQVRVTAGEMSKTTCVVVGNEASCNYTKLSTRLPQGKPTKFETVKIGTTQIWTSIPSGNIKLLIDEEHKIFTYGMTGVVIEKGILLNKQCVGKILLLSK